MMTVTNQHKKMAENGVDKKNIIDDWHMAFKRANDYDLWGQPVEAIECYTKLSTKMRCECQPEEQLWTDEQKKVLKKISTCLEMRAKTLQSPGKLESITLEDMKKIEHTLQNLLTIKAKEFPVQISRSYSSHGSASSSEHRSEVSSHASDLAAEKNSDEDLTDKKLQGTLLPLPQFDPQKTSVTIRVEKIGIKDASQHIDSFLSVSVKDSVGVDLTATQDLPVTHTKDETNIYFSVDVHIQKPLEELSDDVGIFFELKHFKPKKNYISTRCWCLLERDEIKEGQAVLEIYKKPADYKRKKIHLLTSKPMYLHIKIIFNG